jgi:glucan biosynthesis protein C
MAAGQAGERFHALDAVRGFALMLGIFFHGVMSFLPGEWVWFVMDDARSPLAIVIFFTSHMFRMTTFFVIAGFFAHMLYHKRGAVGFIRNRAARIALPLVIFWPIVYAGIIGAVILMATMAGLTEPPPDAPTPVPVPFAFPLTHLWFLYVLLLMYAAVMVLRAPIAAVDRGGKLRAGVDAVVGWIVRTPLVGPIVLGAPAAALFITNPEWMLLTGIPTPDNSLVPNVTAAVAYGLAFGLGWLLHRNYDAMRAWAKQWWLYLPIAIGLTAVCLSIHGLQMPDGPTAPGPQKVIAALCYAPAIWCWTFAFIGFALRFLDSESPTRRYIADASYWMYILHLPLVMALQAAITHIPGPWWAKYAGLMFVTFAILFASYQLLVRHTFIGTLLNGPRPKRTKANAAGGLAAPAS